MFAFIFKEQSMIVYGNLKIMGFLEGAFKPLDAYPENPKVGTVAFIHKRFMICGEIDNQTPYWIPLTNEVDTHIHSQSTPSDTWDIPHKLNFSTPIIQCYDENNRVVNPNEVAPIDQDTLRVTFPEPIMGRAIIVVGDFSGVSKPEVVFQMEFNDETELVVPHGLGYVPNFVILSQDGYEIQPKSIRHAPDFSNSTIEFNTPTSGRIRVQ